MRSARRCASVLAAMALALPAPAWAGLMDFTGELRVSLGALGSFTAAGTGAADVTPGTLALTLPSGVFALSTTVPLTGRPPFTRLAVDFENGAGSFGPGAGPDGGFGAGFFGMTLDGRAAVGFSSLETTLIPIVLAGHGGSFPLPADPLTIISTIWGAWTVGPVSRVIRVGSATSTTLRVTGADQRTAGGVGTLSMITPITVFQGADPFFDVPLYAEVTLRFVPEPSRALLLASGGLVLALLGRRRLRALASR